VDPRTGLAHDVDPTVGGNDDLPFGVSSPQTLAFAPDGTLYGAWGELVTLDPATGVATLVGGSYADVRGLAYLSDTLQIELDVRPSNERDHINTRSRGLVPVALLGTPSFDVRDVDVGSLGFGPAHAPVEKRAKVRDVTRDGEADLIVRFRSDETGLEPGETEACLEGALRDGTPLRGCTAVSACGLGFEGALALVALARARSALARRRPPRA
jgi:hypothetical protein